MTDLRDGHRFTNRVVYMELLLMCIRLRHVHLVGRGLLAEAIMPLVHITSSCS